MQNLLAKALLEDTGYPVSAVVSVAGNRILGVQLFGSDFFGDRMRIEPGATEVWLMSNHESGGRTMSEADVRNLRSIRALAGARRVRLFFTSEYYACMEISLFDEEEADGAAR